MQQARPDRIVECRGDALWLVVEAVIALRRYSRSEPVESLDVEMPES